MEPVLEKAYDLGQMDENGASVPAQSSHMAYETQSARAAFQSLLQRREPDYVNESSLFTSTLSPDKPSKNHNKTTSTQPLLNKAFDVGKVDESSLSKPKVPSLSCHITNPPPLPDYMTNEQLPSSAQSLLKKAFDVGKVNESGLSKPKVPSLSHHIMTPPPLPDYIATERPPSEKLSSSQSLLKKTFDVGKVDENSLFKQPLSHHITSTPTMANLPGLPLQQIGKGSRTGPLPSLL